VTDLAKEYGSPRLNNKDEPVDELFFILLSQMTTGPSYERVYDRLKHAIREWDQLLTLHLDALQMLIADAGLSNQKAPRLLAIARRLHDDFGRVTMDALKTKPDRAVEAYLTQLPGVGVKTAKCVMMYAMGRKVLPADTHVRRVAARIGLIEANLSERDLHSQLEATVAPADRFDFHVNALAHGREVCRAIRPRCDACVLSSVCATAKAHAVSEGGKSRSCPPRRGHRTATSPE
jgi:endonuclease III